MKQTLLGIILILALAQNSLAQNSPVGGITEPPRQGGNGTGGGPISGGGNGNGSGPVVVSPRLIAEDVGIVVNDLDANSVALAKYYKIARGIPDKNIIHVRIPKPWRIQITPAEFQPVKDAVDKLMPANVQAIAIAWTKPYKVWCNSITSALSRGVMAGPCTPVTGVKYPTCAFATPSPYYGSASHSPFKDYGMRISMMLAGATLADAKSMIDRGVASDATFPTGKALLMKTTDTTRSLRARNYSGPLGYGLSRYVDVQVVTANSISNTTDTLFYFQGLPKVANISTNAFPPGAVGDHLTSFGGNLVGSSTQMSCLQFVRGPYGATGTFGTVSEPCAYQQKFPNATMMINAYTRGDTLIEAYWKSVQQTFQGLFVGEPLARPWGYK